MVFVSFEMALAANSAMPPRAVAPFLLVGLLVALGTSTAFARESTCQSPETVRNIPTSDYFRAGELRLHYLNFGGRGQPVLLLAGLGNSAWIWSDFAPKLACKGFHVMALTRRGHGDSDAPAKGYSLEDMVTDIVAFMDQQSIPKAIFVGHSIAGSEMTRLASVYPERVIALAYIEAAYDRQEQLKTNSHLPQVLPLPSDKDRESLDSFFAFQRKAQPEIDRAWGPALKRDFQATFETDSSGKVVPRHPEANLGELIESASSGPPDYSVIRAPALAIYAKNSGFELPADVPLAARQQMRQFDHDYGLPWVRHSEAEFREGMKKGKAVELKGGHLLFLESPDAVIGLITDFMLSLSLRVHQ